MGLIFVCYLERRRQNPPPPRTVQRQSQRRASRSDVQGLEGIYPVAGIHLPVWSESDSGALLIYAETCVSTGTLEFSGGGG